MYYLETRKFYSQSSGSQFLADVCKLIENLEKREGDYYYLIINTENSLFEITSWCIGIRSEVNNLGVEDIRVSSIGHKRIFIKFSDLLNDIPVESDYLSIASMSSDYNEHFIGIIFTERVSSGVYLLVNPKINNGGRILRSILNRT
jgi:hypothetical protein